MTNEAIQRVRDGYATAEDTVGANGDGERFVNIGARLDCDAIGVSGWRGIYAAQFKNSWKGAQCMKTCFELVVYPELIRREGIRTIIEFGSYDGGGICFLADAVTADGVDGAHHRTFIGVDIDLSHLHPEALAHSAVTFVQASTFQSAEFFSPENGANWPHPWLVIEDAHYGCEHVLDALHPVAKAGDYIIVEDTNVSLNQASIDLFPNMDREEIDVCLENLAITRRFATKHEGGSLYQIDTRYQDWFGYNVLKAQNGVLRRMR